jgi:hypothetical protein
MTGERLLGSDGDRTMQNLVLLASGEVTAEELGPNYARGPGNVVSVQVDEQSYQFLKEAVALTRPLPDTQPDDDRQADR